MTYVPASEDLHVEDARPLVAQSRLSNTGVWVFAVVCLLGGYMLFDALNDRRTDAQGEGIATSADRSETFIASPPPLSLPPEFAEANPPLARPILLRATPRTINSPPPAPPAPRAQPQPRSASSAVTPPVEPSALSPPAFSLSGPDGPAPRIVYDAARDGVTPPRDRAVIEEGRVKATRFSNPAFTVPRGTVIPAVLETAIDSTRPGAVRALVQRDVRGFDGSRVLIHRGSRLYGEYSGDIAQGQKRALVKWVRLIRPDGVIIQLDSPASDPLGRAGIEGDVDTHFWTRFGNALLGTALDVGGTLAAGAIGGGVVVLPGGQQVARTQTQGPQPTLRVDHGTSVSVFVAQDLDFSDVDR